MILRPSFLPLAGLTVASLLSLTSVVRAGYELTDEQKKVPLETEVSDASAAKVVLLAGVVSNKPGQHEYFAGCTMLLKCLKENAGVAPVLVAGGWPQNEAVLDHAKTVVIYMDGAEKLAFLPQARWERMRKLVADGTGLVLLHQAVDCPPAQAEEFKSWFGAVFKKETSCRGHWDMRLDPVSMHPILSGVVAYDAPKDGWLYNLQFASTGVTPILAGAVPATARTTTDAKSHVGRAETMAWAYERPDGGRSFGFTGCDLHKNWGVEAQRRLVVNAVLWTAKLPVPSQGTAVAIEPGDLTSNFDAKPAPRPLLNREVKPAQ